MPLPRRSQQSSRVVAAAAARVAAVRVAAVAAAVRMRVTPAVVAHLRVVAVARDAAVEPDEIMYKSG